MSNTLNVISFTENLTFRFTENESNVSHYMLSIIGFYLRPL